MREVRRRRTGIKSLPIMGMVAPPWRQSRLEARIDSTDRSSSCRARLAHAAKRRIYPGHGSFCRTACDARRSSNGNKDHDIHRSIGKRPAASHRYTRQRRCRGEAGPRACRRRFFGFDHRPGRAGPCGGSTRSLAVERKLEFSGLACRRHRPRHPAFRSRLRQITSRFSKPLVQSLAQKYSA
jgi:hypothetical protein